MIRKLIATNIFLFRYSARNACQSKPDHNEVFLRSGKTQSKKIISGDISEVHGWLARLPRRYKFKLSLNVIVRVMSPAFTCFRLANT